eukprot:scaffold13359_cov111-Isochrysis_galbana.AAC.3
MAFAHNTWPAAPRVKSWLDLAINVTLDPRLSSSRPPCQHSLRCADEMPQSWQLRLLRIMCHRYLRTAERLLTAAAEAKVASPRTIINFCELGGNHTDPNPPNRGKGKNKHVRHSGRGRGGVAEFYNDYNRSTDNSDCFFFQMGKCKKKLVKP